MKLNIPDTYKLLYLCESGSTLFGTRTETSDTDYKGIYLADLNSIILKEDIEQVASSTGNEKKQNSKTDVDVALFSLQRFLKDVENGETGAIDLLFSIFSTELHHHFDPQFKLLITEHFPKLLSKKPKAFVGYCLSQTKKYGVKGARLNSLIQADKMVNDFLLSIEPDKRDSVRVSDLLSTAEATLLSLDFIELTSVKTNDSGTKEYLSILGKEYEKTIKVSHLKNLLSKHISNYGDRSKAALNGKDLKSISHAVRTIDELIELLSTGKIVFPLRNAKFITDVKTGAVPYEEALEYIEEQMLKITPLLNSSILPEVCDHATIAEIILSFFDLS